MPNGPSDTATFDFSNTTAVSLSADTEVNGVVFSASATNPFTITASPASRLLIDGVGIANNSGVAQRFVAGVDALGRSGSIQFGHRATSGSSTVFTMEGGSVSGGTGGVTQFLDSSTTNNGTFISSGGTASGAAGGTTLFENKSSAADSTFIAYGGTVSGAGGGIVEFSDKSFLRNGVTLIADGGVDGAAGGSIRFVDQSNTRSPDIIGSPRVEVFGNGNLDLRHSQGLLVASLNGNGNVFLGFEFGGLGIGLFNKDLVSNFSGVIQGGGPGGAGLVIGSAVTLSGANTYGGHTIITTAAGVGFINNRSGSGTGFGPVLVFNDGTLAGNGTIAGAVTIAGSSLRNAFLSPGATENSTGTLTIQSTLDFTSGVFDFELNSDTGTADQVLANGVTLNPLFSLFSFHDLGSGALTPGSEFTAIENTGLRRIHGTFGNLPDGFVFIGGFNTFEVDYQGGDGNDLTLTVSNPANVPDGGTTLSLLTLAVSGLTLLRRKIA